MTVALASNALTTLDAAAAELGLVSYNAELLTRAINAASDFCAGYCGRNFGRQTVTGEKHVGTDTRLLLCDVTPLVTITSVSYLGSALDASEYEVDDANAGTILRIGGVFPRDYSSMPRKEWSLAYVGGYVLPWQDGTGTPAVVRDLPYDIERACIRMAVTQYRAIKKRGDVVGESLNGYSVQYRSCVETDQNMDPEVKQTLDLYRRVA